MRAQFTVSLAVLAAVILTGCCSPINRDLASCSASRALLEREREHLVAQVDQATAARDAASGALTASTERYNSELNATHAQLEALQRRFDASEARRLQLENSHVGILSNQLDKCTADMNRASADFRVIYDRDVKSARYTGRLEGANRVLSSIQVAGRAEKVSGLIFDDYYYSFQVRVGNNAFVNMRIQTKREETGFGSALAGIKNLAPTVISLLAAE